MRTVSRETPSAPPAAERIFGAALPLAIRYAGLLVGAGVDRGLLGPREAERIWPRHLLNCAVVEKAVPADARLVDVGSGAGLPGLVLAVLRPDLSVTLVEPLERRAAFLREAVELLELGHVEVRRARAEELPAGLADVVTARAVAPLDRLAAWCLPLLAPGGRLLALKGDRAGAELADATPVLRRLGTTDATVRRMGLDVLDDPTTVVIVTAGGRPRAADGRRPRRALPGGDR